MRVANFVVNPGALDFPTPTLNYGNTFWLPVVAGSEQDPMVALEGGGIRFDEAGLYLVTANFGAEVTLPTYASDQWAEVFGVLNIGISEGTAG